MVEAEFLSLDPYMRAISKKAPLGSTMVGSQVAKIIESKHSKFKVGERICGYLGWRSHTVLNPETPGFRSQKPYLIPDTGEFPASAALGVLGMPG